METQKHVAKLVGEPHFLCKIAQNLKSCARTIFTRNFQILGETRRGDSEVRSAQVAFKIVTTKQAVRAIKMSQS